MTRGRTGATLAIVVILLLGAAGCGQMGPLTLPDDDVVDDEVDEDGDDANER